MIDVRDLECLVTLGEELHFHRAAARLRLAQPALSKRIQKIELELGLQLFTRGAGSVALTFAGSEVLGHARAMLGSWNAMSRAAEHLRAGVRGVVRIGAVGSAFYEALPRLLARARAELPEISLQVDEMETPALVEALRFGDVQLGFVRPPVSFGLEMQTVWLEELVLAVHERNPLAARDRVAVHELAEETVVFFHRAAGAGYWDRVAALFQQAGLEFAPIERADHVSTILGLVALDVGVSIVPWSAQRVAIPGVSYVRLEEAELLPLAVASNPELLSRAAQLVLSTMPETPTGPQHRGAA